MATAMATLVSIDKLTIFPSIVSATASRRFFDFAYVISLRISGRLWMRAGGEI